MKNRKYKFLFTISIIFIVTAGYLSSALIPYTYQAGVSEETKKAFNLSSYYSNSLSPDRAAVLPANGDALRERIRLIANARESIILCTFDFRSDTSGKLVLSALCDAAARGVDVKILIDGYSYFNNMMGKDYFMAAGTMDNITIKVYNPVNLLRPWKLMARMHDKYLIADDTAYILGGRNTFDYFLGDCDGYKNHDWDVLVCNTGSPDNSSLTQLKEYFHSVWELKECKIVMDSVVSLHKGKVSKSRDELKTIYKQLQDSHSQWFLNISYEDITVETNKVQLLSNPIESSSKEPVLFYNMTELMAQSGGKITFHTPYILCNDYMEKRLSRICSINDQITMMTNSVANNGNPFGAADYLLHKEDLLKTGLHILEYDNGISYHGKCFTIGDRISAVGSFNWDMRSAYIDTETMVVIDSLPFNDLMKEAMSKYESVALRNGETSREISKKRSLRIKLLKPLIPWLRFLM